MQTEFKDITTIKPTVGLEYIGDTLTVTQMAEKYNTLGYRRPSGALITSACISKIAHEFGAPKRMIRKSKAQLRREARAAKKAGMILVSPAPKNVEIANTIVHRIKAVVESNLTDKFKEELILLLTKTQTGVNNGIQKSS